MQRSLLERDRPVCNSATPSCKSDLILSTPSSPRQIVIIRQPQSLLTRESQPTSPASNLCSPNSKTYYTRQLPYQQHETFPIVAHPPLSYDCPTVYLVPTPEPRLRHGHSTYEVAPIL